MDHILQIGQTILETTAFNRLLSIAEEEYTAARMLPEEEFEKTVWMMGVSAAASYYAREIAAGRKTEADFRTLMRENAEAESEMPIE